METLSDNFYKKGSAEEQLDLIESESQRMQEIEHAAAKAKACMSTEEFKSYREQYAKLESVTINSMIKYTRNYFKSGEVKMDTYAMTMMRYVLQLSTFRLIVDQVETRARSA